MSNITLRNFEIRQKLGSGSYGTIYKVYNKTDKSVCVLKQISLSRLSQKARKNAANEAQIMGRLKHPFIVCHFQSFIQDNNLNILMEFCDGGDLCYYLKQQNKKFLKEQKIWKFFIQICMGLEHIHKNKILHRDIKTLNIFLNKDESVKIGDLGVAKMLNSADFAHTMVGTPFYLSPELCQQKPYNQKSDIWALGCLLYELCTFKHPFQATNQASLILKIIRGKYDPIPQFYSKQLNEIINLCLERDYKRRPTANMILLKPHIRKMIQEFSFNKIIQDYYAKPLGNQIATVPLKVPVSKNNEQKPIAKSEQKAKPIQKEHKKCLDEGITQNAQKMACPPKVTKIQKSNQKGQKKIQDEKNQVNHISKRRQSQPALKFNQKQDKPKLLFGNEESKAQFISAIQNKYKSPPKKINTEYDRKQIPKKQAISFQIPWKQKIKQVNDRQKITIFNKNIFHQNEKKDDLVHKVKMQKKVQPKIYQNAKPVGIIKSGGFSNDRPQTGNKRKDQQQSNQNKVLIKQNKVQDQKKSEQKIKKPVTNSMKYIRKQSQQRPSFLNKKQDIQNNGNILHYPPKFKKPSMPSQAVKIRQKNVAHQSKSNTSSSRFTEVTKQEEDLVANLPDIVNSKGQESNLKQEQNKQKKIQFNQIDNDYVARMYEQMMNSKSNKFIQIQQKKQQEQISKKQNDQLINQSPSLVQKDINSNYQQQQQDCIQQQEVPQQQLNNSQVYYEINRYETAPPQYKEQQREQEHQKHEKQQQQWSFDQQPELPLLQEQETPLFQQANPYLVQQSVQVEQKSLQQLTKDKKTHLQIKLKQNIKREDEINRLMQLKIQECKVLVPKNFQQILSFFRTKINMDRQYTAEDQKQVQSFLAKRNLTDQRKFQNIYKIMHFEMQLENTRRIIQSICKKLSELENQN